MKPAVIAHRGASAYELENTLRAFRLAADMGADGVELDVHSTKDGVIVVHHDARIGGSLIADRSTGELLSETLKNGDPVPLLHDALEAVVGNAFIEVKDLAPEADGALFEAVDVAGPVRCRVHSFNHQIIRRLSRQRADLTFGVLSVSLPVEPTHQWRDAGADELWQSRNFIDEALVERCHDDGVKVYVWTVDEPEEVDRMIRLGVDGICTNKPDIVRDAIDR